MAGQGGALVPLSNGQTCIKTSAPQLPIARKYQDQGALPATGSTKQGFGAGVVQSRVFTTNSMEQRRSTLLPSRSRSRSPYFSSSLIFSPSLYPSLCLLLTYLLRTKQPRRPLKSPPTTAPCSLAVGLRRSRPELSRHCWSWLPDDRYQWRPNTSGGVPSEFFAGLERAGPARHNAHIFSLGTPPEVHRPGKGVPPPRYGPP